MDRWRAAGALLALAACIACTTAAPYASNQTSLDLYDGPSDGCYYNFQHYGEGDRIMTNEPCLNCTCHNRMLMCYLRVCPFTKPIGQDCTVEKRADQCCPIVTCPDVPVDLLTSTSTSSPAEYGSTGLGKLDKYGCSISGKYFPEGSKVPPTPNKPCEHCYCIRNMTTCVMQECTLHVDGCTPIYHKEVCCPVRYSCDHPEDEIPLLDDMTTTVRPTPGFLLTTTTLSPVTQMTQDCVHDDQMFPDGALIKTEKACEHCYCMKGDIVCVVQECGTPMENEGKNCTSMPPREGQCCPDTYICEGDESPTDFTTPEYEGTTQLPTRRVEGSGYRDIPEESYTEIPTSEPEFEGSGEVQMTLEPVEPTDIPDKKTPGLYDSTLITTDELLHISTTTKPVVSEEPEKETTEIDEGQNTVPSGFEESSEASLVPKTTSIVPEDLTEPESHVTSVPVGEEKQTVSPDVSITSAPDSDEKHTLSPEDHMTSLDSGDRQTVSPDVDVTLLPTSPESDDKQTSPDVSVTSQPDSEEQQTISPDVSMTSIPDSEEKQTVSPDVRVTPLPDSEEEQTVSPDVSITSVPDSEEKQTVSPDIRVTPLPDSEEEQTTLPDVSFTSVPDSEEKQTVSPDVRVTPLPDSEEEQTALPDVSFTSVPDSEEKQTVSPDVRVTPLPDSEDEKTVLPDVSITSVPDSEEKQTVSPDVRVTPLPDSEEEQTALPDVSFTSVPDSEEKQTVSPDVRVTPLLDSEDEKTVLPDVSITSVPDSEEKQTVSLDVRVTPLPDSEEEQTALPDVSFTSVPDSEEKQTVSPDVKVTPLPDSEEEKTVLPDVSMTSVPDSEEEQTISPDIKVTPLPESEEEQTVSPDVSITSVPDSEQKQTVSPDVRVTPLPDSEEEQTALPDVSFTSVPDSEEKQTVSSDVRVTPLPDSEEEQTVLPDVGMTSGPDSEEKQTVSPDVRVTPLLDSEEEKTVLPDVSTTSVPDSEEEQTISPDVKVTPLSESEEEQTVSPEISVTSLPESGEKQTVAPAVTETPLLDSEEKQTTFPDDLVTLMQDTKEKPTASPDRSVTSLPDSDEKRTVSPDLSETLMTDSDEKPTTSPDLSVTSLPDSEEKETISPEGSVTSSSDIGERQTVSPGVSETSSPTVEEVTEIHETSLPGSDDMKTIHPDAHVTSLPDSSISREYEYTMTTEQSPKLEETTGVLKETSTQKYDEKVTSSVSEGNIEFTTTESAFPSIEQEAKSTTVQLPDFTNRVEETDKLEKPEEHTEIPGKMSSPYLYVDEKEASTTTSAIEEEAQPSSTTPGKVEAFEATTLKDVESGRIPGEGDCLLDGITYRNNSEVASYNKCYSSCKCVSSIVKCDPIICSPPPEDTGMDNCMQVYDTEGSCCPTYVCDDGRRTIPPESQSHVSGTESPIPTQKVECSGEECHLDTEKKPEKGGCGPEGCGAIQTSADDCTDGKCQEAPTKETPCNKESGCELSHSRPCEGENCMPSVESKPFTEEPACANEEECKKVQAPASEGVSCESGACKTTQPGGKPTESDTTTCEGEKCKAADKTTPTEILPQPCENNESCKETKIPEHDTPPCENDDCKFIPPKQHSSPKPITEPCKGDECETDIKVIPTATSLCDKNGDCKEPDDFQPDKVSCDGENCKAPSEVPPTVGFPETDTGTIPSDNLPEECKNENDCKQIQVEPSGCLGENCEGEISTRGPESGDCVGDDCKPEECTSPECLQQTVPSEKETTDANLHTESPTSYETTHHLGEASEGPLGDTSSKPTETSYTSQEELHPETPDQEKSTVTPYRDVIKESETDTPEMADISTESPQFTQTADKGTEPQISLTETEHLTGTPEIETHKETTVSSEAIEPEQKKPTLGDLYTTRYPVTEESTKISEFSASELDITERSSTPSEVYDEKVTKTEELPHVTSSNEYTTESPLISESHEIMKTTTLSSSDLQEISTKTPEIIKDQEESSTATKPPSTEKQQEITRYVPEDVTEADTNIPELEGTKIPELEQPSSQDISTKVPESESEILTDHTQYEEKPKVTESSVDETTKHIQISEEPVTDSQDKTMSTIDYSTELPKQEIDKETELPDTHVKPFEVQTSTPVEFETKLPESRLTDKPPTILPDLVVPTTEILIRHTTEPSIEKLSTKFTDDHDTESTKLPEHVEVPIETTTVKEDHVTKQEISEEQTIQTLSPEVPEQESTVSPVVSVTIAEGISTSGLEISETEPPLSQKPDYEITTEAQKSELPEVVVTEVPEHDYTTRMTELEHTALFATGETKETHDFDATGTSEEITEKVEKTTELPSRRHEETSTISLEHEISTKEPISVEVESATESDKTGTKVETFTESGISEPYIPVHEEKTTTKPSMTFTEGELAITEHTTTVTVAPESSSSEEYDHVTKDIEEGTESPLSISTEKQIPVMTESSEIMPEKSESEVPVDQLKETEKERPEQATESLDVITGEEIQTESPQTLATETVPKPSKRPEDNFIDQEEVTESPETLVTQKEHDEEPTQHYITKEPEIYTETPESQVTSQKDISKTEKPKEHELPSTESYAGETKTPEIIPTETLQPPKEHEFETQPGTEPPVSEFTESQTTGDMLPEEPVSIKVVEMEQPEIQQPSTGSPLSPGGDKETASDFPVTEGTIPTDSDVTKGQTELVTEKTKDEEQVTEQPATLKSTEKVEISTVTESYEIATKLTEEQPLPTDSSIEVTTKFAEEPETEEVTKLTEVSSKSPDITTLEPQYKYSETTPYLVELEEHTHKVEIASTVFETELTTKPQETDDTMPLLEVSDVTTEKHITEEEQQPEVPKDDQEKPSVDDDKLLTTTEGPHIIESQTTITAEGEQEPQRTEKPSITEIESTTLPASDIEEESKLPTDIPKESVDKEITSPTSEPLDKDLLSTISPVPETAEPAAPGIEMPVQPEKEFTPGTQPPTVSEEEKPAVTSEAPSKLEEIDTPPSPYDKFTKPEAKPTEAYPTPEQASEVSKPSHGVQPVDEIPSPEDEGHFPPSGTGYGHEPDYMEEDQAFGPGTCRYGGKVYVSAQQIPRDDPCDFCFCFRSDIICLQQSCPPPIHGCHEEPIQGFCCPRYECPVSMATTLNVTTTTTTTTTTLPPHFLPHAYKGMAQRRGCQIKGHTYKVGEVVRASSGPCLHCTCGGDGQMKCDPKACTPEPMLRQMIAAAVSSKRRR